MSRADAIARHSSYGPLPDPCKAAKPARLFDDGGWRRRCGALRSAARVREMKVQGLGATAIAEALGIGRVSVYRVL